MPLERAGTQKSDPPSTCKYTIKDPYKYHSIDEYGTVLHRDTIVYRRGHRNLPARPSKMTGAAIETYRRGHRK